MREFYSSQFIGHTPVDAVLHPNSRTVSAQRVIDEFVFEFTHDSELPWMLPGVAPTGRRVRIPMVVVMGFDGEKVAYEHIYWDQASVLMQLGMLDPAGPPLGARRQADKAARARALAELGISGGSDPLAGLHDCKRRNGRLLLRK